MPGSLDPRQRSGVFGLISALVPGQVTTFDRLSEATGLSVRALQHMLDRLTDTERTTVPWHRVVAGGGAIGRHARAAEQRQRLLAEGVEVSPAGVVQDLPRRLQPPGPQPEGGKAEAPAGGRARGSRSHPSSTV